MYSEQHTKAKGSECVNPEVETHLSHTFRDLHDQDILDCVVRTHHLRS